MSTKTETGKVETSVPVFRSRSERIAAGKALRNIVPRESHEMIKRSAERRDPLIALEESNRGRVPELIPIRYGRMLRSPFTFLRGSAGLMASDLAGTPNTGIQVQACGDCHVLNFGLFATPERNLVFDINDFDETLPAPWEWDVKRLAASIVVAARDDGLSDGDAKESVRSCVRSYREQLREFSKLTPLEVWYACLDMQRIIDESPNEKSKTLRQEYADKARTRVIEYLFPKIVAAVGGRHRFIDQPPALFHVTDADAEERFNEGMADYRQTLSDERRVLLDRYIVQDFAMKAVGIGSVGTRCFIGLLFSADNHPLILQIKEARRSVLEPYTQESCYENQGQRVVIGQRLMQSSSDIFLGWVRGRRGFDFYVRQLRDMKFSIPLEGYTSSQLNRYVKYCGWSLAHAHAKSGDAATIGGYLGKGDAFDEALGDFAIAYADQNEQDYAALVKAERTGRIQALFEEG